MDNRSLCPINYFGLWHVSNRGHSNRGRPRFRLYNKLSWSVPYCFRRVARFFAKLIVFEKVAVDPLKRKAMENRDANIVFNH